MGVISKHREGNSMDILKLHGLDTSNQYLSLIMALLLTIGMANAARYLAYRYA